MLLTVIDQPIAVPAAQVHLARRDGQRAVFIRNIIIAGHVAPILRDFELHAVFLRTFCDLGYTGFIVMHKLYALPGHQASALDGILIRILAHAVIYQRDVGRADCQRSFFNDHLAHVHLDVIIRGAVLPRLVGNGNAYLVIMSAHVGRYAVRRDEHRISAVQRALGELEICRACTLSVVNLGDVDGSAVLDLIRHHDRDLLGFDLDCVLQKVQRIARGHVVTLFVTNDHRGRINMADRAALPVIGKIAQLCALHAVPLGKRAVGDLPMLAERGLFAVFKLGTLALGTQRNVAAVQRDGARLAVDLFAKQALGNDRAHFVRAGCGGLLCLPILAALARILAPIRAKQHKAIKIRLIAKRNRFALQRIRSEVNTAQREIAKQQYRAQNQQQYRTLDAYFPYARQGNVSPDLFLVCLVNHKNLRKM